LLWKKALDISIVGFIITFIAIWAVICNVPFLFESDSQTPFNAIAAMVHLKVAFYSIATIDIFTSATFLWRRLKEAVMSGIFDYPGNIR